MRRNQDNYYLEGLQEHLEAIRQYCPQSREEFMADAMLQDAILMRLMSLGEEAGCLSDEFKEKYPSIPWHQIIGLRNRLAHGYFTVDPEVVWGLLTDGSLDELEKLLAGLSDKKNRRG